MSDDKARPRQLGRGLEALFGDDRAAVVAQASEPVAVAGLRRVAISRLIPNPLQPRRYFDDAALRDLAASIRENGILQPLIVRPTRHDPDSFEIVAGERRWRAAQRAQLHEAPVIVRDFTDAEALAVALIENIQRDELSPLEEAQAYARLAGDFSKTQEQVAEAVGKSRSHVANMIRLLALPAEVQDLLADGSLTAGHARAILTAADPLALAKRIVTEGLSVRAAEKLGREGGAPSANSGRGKAAGIKRLSKDADTLALERELGNMLGLKVGVEFDGKGGRLTFEYTSLEQLDDLIDRLTGRRPQLGPDHDYEPDEDNNP